MTVVEAVTGIAGGLAFLFFGLETVTRAAAELWGRQLTAWLCVYTGGRIRAALVGVPLSFALPYPSAAPSLATALGDAGFLAARQAVGLALGAAIGSALTIEIIAFDLGTWFWSTAVIIAGLAVAAFSRNERVAAVGRLLVGAGLVFFGIAFMERGVDVSLHSPQLDALRSLVERLSSNRFYLFVLGILLAALLRSSVAVMALAFAFDLAFTAVIPLALGANVGGCSAFFLSRLSARPFGRQFAFANLVTRLFGASFFMLILPRFTDAVDVWHKRLDITSQHHIAANANLITGLLTAVIFLPLVPLVEQFVLSLAGSVEEGLFSPVTSSDLENPPAAIEKARVATVRAARLALTILRKNLSAFLVDERSVRSEITDGSRAVAASCDAIPELLRRLDETRLSHHDSQMRNRLASIVKDIRSVAGLVAGPLSSLARSKSRANLDFSIEAAQRLERFHRLVADDFAEAIDLLEGLPSSPDRVIANAGHVEAMRQSFLSMTARSASQTATADAEINRILQEAIPALTAIHYCSCDIIALLRTRPESTLPKVS